MSDPNKAAANERILGPSVTFTPPPPPGQQVIESPWIRLERLSASRHADQIFDLLVGHDWVWDYMPVGPFHAPEDFRAWITAVQDGTDPCFFAIVDQATGKTLGHASFLRIDPPNGVIEIGHIMLSPILQRSREAGAALMAMVSWAFDAGYRRVEWKCNALNLPSRRAALRLGFSYEGTFRQHMIVKGRNRDTAWFAITDKDWQALSGAYETWLSPDNFDDDGAQRVSLSSLTEAALPGRHDG